MVGQNVQPNPHHMEVCDEHREESDGWQDGRAAARSFTRATEDAATPAPGSQSRSAATAAGPEPDETNVGSGGRAS